MYTTKDIIKGIQNPSLVRTHLSRIYDICRPHDVGVQGSYRTGNIGDRALGELFQRQFSENGYRTHIHDKHVQFSSSKVKVLGGGGVLHDFYGTEHLRKRLNYVSDGGFIIGVGVPGLRSAEAQRLIRSTLPEISLITVRDQRSKEILKDICDAEVVRTACPAFLYQNPDCSPNNRTGVNFRPWFNRKSENLSYYFDYDDQIDPGSAKADYIKNIKRLCEEVERPLFIPFHKEDEEFARKHLDIEVLQYENSVKKTLERVSKVEKMITMRYHSLIFAAVCQKPVLPIAYAPKVKSLTDRLEIQSYKPHTDIPLKFQEIQNLSKLKKYARDNFKLMFESNNF
ncbi:polysaccharide pyruvyl transferase family protein [Halogeometricum borinquense]|uniref:Polysaccharide pyruvyl transferase family protein n=1 Tax=Halogeometricum borinquense TaxID=60847 RepID=A0A6C0URF3_9EURY|nr:polysaccharide pyruvyl transferase family protein [Halogeometricum borinquense]QIB75518.1 polysaccharide pyruvyl transferase family protein [Halogeometricum borinquense]